MAQGGVIVNLAKHDRCTGCAACVNVCPFDAITMMPDEEGFLQPKVEMAKCRHCGKCEQACPIVSPRVQAPPQIEKHPICGISRSMDTWRASSSGGAFTEICAALEGRNPVIFGARFDGPKRVCHDFAEGVGAIGPFRKSKYVQSDIGFTFRKCREFLNAGRFVIYAASPCQIAGLRGFLGRDFDNLLTLEFICHGSGSPKFFADCLTVIEKDKGKSIKEYGFRTKSDDLRESELYQSRYCFSDGTVEVVAKDLYNKFFLSQLCLRKSCMENCPFRTPNRFADITYADCRGEKRLYPDKDDKNWSVIVANTEKGSKVVERLYSRMELYDYSVELLEATNPLYYHTTPGNPRRAEFFSLYRGGKMSITRIGKKLRLIDPQWKIVGQAIKRRLRRLAAWALCK